ncbi:hypothetical protein BV20DRAFT_98847 [Pilatotrama ljubarskyi]|nr:hypothetical protein BV20DRAFT_98847 [Pilatotrama ljubarskyi]
MVDTICDVIEVCNDASHIRYAYMQLTPSVLVRLSYSFLPLAYRRPHLASKACQQRVCIDSGNSACLLQLSILPLLPRLHSGLSSIPHCAHPEQASGRSFQPCLWSGVLFSLVTSSLHTASIRVGLCISGAKTEESGDIFTCYKAVSSVRQLSATAGSVRVPHAEQDRGCCCCTLPEESFLRSAGRSIDQGEMQRGDTSPGTPNPPWVAQTPDPLRTHVRR